MTKLGGRYYLQYGAPGTEFNVYANGTYVSDKPLGPFTYAPYNPIAYKPGGFVQGAGHGSTFQDRYGNWWNTGTPWIGYNWTFERRIDMLPGEVLPRRPDVRSSSRFADFPHYVPTIEVRRSRQPVHRLDAAVVPKAGERLVDAWANSARPRSPTKIREPSGSRPQNKPGETLTVDLGKVDTVRAVQVNFADYKSGRFADAPDIYTEFALAGLGRRPALAGDRAHRAAAPRPAERLFRARLSRSARASSATSTAMSARPTSRSATFAYSAMRTAARRQRPRGVAAARHADQRDATIRWAKVPGAVGYNIRFGIRPDRLTLTYQLWADELGNGADARAKSFAR